MICPFFGKNEDYCDTGCGYISPSDVRNIIQFCSSHPDRCPVFQDLMERHPMEAASAHREESPLYPPPPTLPQPTAASPVQTSISNIPKPATTNKHPVASFDTLVHPAPSGLLAFGMTAALFSFHHTGIFNLDASMLGMGIFYGGLSQIVVGFMEWKRHHAFGATTFTSLGLFWLSLLAMTILPDTRFGQFPQDAAMTAYLVLWGLFAAVLFIGALKLNKSLQFVLGSLILFYFLLAIGTATGNKFITAIAGWEGALCASSAIYTGLAQILNEIFGRSVVPLGEQNTISSSTIQNRPS